VANQETCTWIGRSGQKYTYYVFPRHPSVNPGQDGNYIYSKKTLRGNGSLSIWARAIYQKERPRIIIGPNVLT
jgi:hypothetical protein